MKKAVRAICLILVLCMALTPLCYADDDYETLSDWNLKIKIPEGATGVFKGGSYVIYPQHVGYIPYLMISAYHYDSEETFIADLTRTMQKSYADLEVVNEAYQAHYGEKLCWEIDYSYTVSGQTVSDRRIAVKFGDWMYMFASKEVKALGMTVGDMLDDLVADCVFLDENGNELTGLEDEQAYAVAYLYCQDDGMPKYWLDLSGAMADALVLHCFFRSGEPTFYETVYYLDLDSADITENRIDVYDVTDARGNDISNWFRALTIRRAGANLVMTVRRDEKTLAGGGDDNLLTGNYRMTPVGAGVNYQYRQDDGMLKYWLDKKDDTIRLHAMFRSGEPEFYEEVFILDSATAEPVGDYGVSFKKVFNEAGFEVSEWFQSLTFTEVENAIIMTVKRDERTLAGGEEDNILSGVYLFEPMTYLLPADNGPYTDKELGQWAQIYYFVHNGFFPPIADVEKNADGSFSIHLYEIVKIDGEKHTATSAWYTVDAYGRGTDDITGRAVDICH